MKSLKHALLLLITAASFSACVVQHRGGWVPGHYEVGPYGHRHWVRGHYA